MTGVMEGGARAVVAVGRLESSFEGVGGLLSKRRRRRLAEAVLLDVLQAIRESRLLQEIVLATRDSHAASVGEREGVVRLGGEGERVSPLQEAIETSVREGVEAVALLRGDLALLEAQDLAFLTGRLTQDPRLVLVPTAGFPGMSLVMARPATVFAGVAFEARDLRSWQREAERQGLAAEVYSLPAGMRLRGPRELLEVYKAPRPSRAKALLKEWGMGPRLRESQEEEP